ncbi:PucR family transcriptional regulator [Pseudarthrobacter sp. NIBRBAC000502772]|uniref:PucR family transcriptional regulator n=1 Tax=Pseudarthrobacter sp. NIBRBAC000502772 TaxID=2590775 RepID=UPI001131E4D7|nr:helix-turn-helix domain-containing protein [Pseudarthrobacter sp. NIBRBAC000502772]QDG68360.1 PucR family transcriptional regulator [Pseudarthrobacter sp. NIBRBAC000502772]
MHNLEDAAVARRWSELVEQLHHRVDVLAKKFISQVREIPEYGESTVETDEIMQTARETFHRLVNGLRNGGNAEAGADYDADISASLGAKRARAGIPAEALVSAVRLDFTILWAELLAIATPEDAPMLTARVDQVWRVVDEFAVRTHTSYLNERVRMAQEESSIQNEFIARLFSVVSPSADTAAQVAEALGVSANARFGLVAASGSAAARLRAAQVKAAAKRNQRFFLRESGDMAYVFWPVAAARTGEVKAVIATVPQVFADIPCGVAEANGLRALPKAARTASSLAALLQPADTGPLSANQAWPRLAKRQLAEAGLDLVEELDAALDPCRGVERERLTEAARHFLQSGSVTLTAEALFCHRNTVLNRLNRFQELTGIDLTVPNQAARLVVAWA